MIIEFVNNIEAEKVAALLYNCKVEKQKIIINQPDLVALKQAIALSTARVINCSQNYPIFEFHRYKRECRSDSIPIIHVSCCMAGSKGLIHQMWVNAARLPSEIEEDIQWFLSFSPVKEKFAPQQWTIDYGKNFDGIKVEEIQNLESISKLALSLCQYGKAFSRFYGYFGYAEDHNVDRAITHFLESYQGTYNNKREFPGYFIRIDPESSNFNGNREYVYLTSHRKIYVFAID